MKVYGYPRSTPGNRRQVFPFKAYLVTSADFQLILNDLKAGNRFLVFPSQGVGYAVQTSDITKVVGHDI
jgi:hypothetical protein